MSSRPALLIGSLLGLFALACGRPQAEREAATSRRDHRVLVIGWDGATFRMVDPLLAAGRLPNVARLLERGVSARLESTRIPISSAAWTTLTTGYEPGQTGVYSFFEPVPDSLAVRLVSAESVGEPPLWRLLSAAGKTCHVFGVPVTWPPETIRGTLAAGMLSPLDAQWATPPEWDASLRERGLVPDLGAWRERQKLTTQRIERQLALKEAALLELLERDDWDLAWFVFKNLDVLAHRAYDGSLDGAVARLYTQLDATLGRLLAAVEGDGETPTDVILLSDHGFTTYERSFNLHPWILHAGFSVIAGPIAAEDRPREGTLVERHTGVHERRLAQLDLSMTRAMAGPVEGNFGSIRLRIVGRDVGGIVEMQHKDELLAEIEAQLREVLDPRTLEPIVTDVWTSEELYPGDRLDLLPDLVFALDETWLCRNDLDLRLFENLAAPRPEHDLWGIFVAAGPSFAPEPARGERRVAEIAPLVLHLLEEPIGADMPGAVPLTLLRGAAGERRVVALERADDRRRVPARREATRSYDAAQSEELRERLDDIGYTD